MSVVAGCLFLDGVLLTADTRITYTRPDGSKVYVDNALKVLPFAPGTAIGYVGAVETASALIQQLIDGRDHRKRIDPASMTRWIPRLLSSAYRRLGQSMSVSFIVASSFEGRTTRVERNKIGEILFQAVSNGLTRLSGTLPLDILGTNAPFVRIPNSSAAILYAMHSPEFEPRFCPPLSFMAIGSGGAATEAIQRAHAGGLAYAICPDRVCHDAAGLSYRRSHSSREMAASRRILPRRSRLMSPACGFGIRSFRRSRIMN